MCVLSGAEQLQSGIHHYWHVDLITEETLKVS